MRNLLRVFFPLLLVFLASCQANPDGLAESQVGQIEILYQDNFSDPSSGWLRGSNENGLSDYVEGGYRIYVARPQIDTWVLAGKDFPDVRIEVDAAKIGGSDDNDFGVICRAQDIDNFYAFLISSDGFYGIFKVVNREFSLLDQEEMPWSSYIKLGSDTNHIRAACIDDTLSLYANGTLLQSSSDTTYVTGDIGMIAGTYDEPGTDILFENYLVNR